MFGGWVRYLNCTRGVYAVSVPMVVGFGCVVCWVVCCGCLCLLRDLGACVTVCGWWCFGANIVFGVNCNIVILYHVL